MKKSINHRPISILCSIWISKLKPIELWWRNQLCKCFEREEKYGNQCGIHKSRIKKRERRTLCGRKSMGVKLFVHARLKISLSAFYAVYFDVVEMWVGVWARRGHHSNSIYRKFHACAFNKNRARKSIDWLHIRVIESERFFIDSGQFSIQQLRRRLNMIIRDKNTVEGGEKGSLATPFDCNLLSHSDDDDSSAGFSLSLKCRVQILWKIKICNPL